MRDTIPRKQQTLRRDIAKGYVRIEASRAGRHGREVGQLTKDNDEKKNAEITQRFSLGIGLSVCQPPLGRSVTRPPRMPPFSSCATRNSER